MPSAQTAIDYQAFLREHLDQPHSIMRYELAHETLWVKRANKGNPALNYWLLSTLARLFSAAVLQPVPNPGGTESLQTEVRRLRSFKAKGLRVPQDISLIGYDNVRNARYFSPALTTIHQPKDSLGEAAFNMLMDRIVNKREESQSIEVHPRLIERRSVADGPFRDYRR